MTSRWTPEAAKSEYERLRQATLAGLPLVGTAAERFARRGLAGLIAWPAAEPVFAATLVGAPRPAWTPHADPRAQALAGAYGLLLDAAADSVVEVRKVR